MGLLASVSVYIYGHLQDTGVNLGRQKVILNRSGVKASIFSSDAEHDAALVKVANAQHLCREEPTQNWPLKCRVLLAYENFAGRISKEDYEQAFSTQL